MSRSPHCRGDSDAYYGRPPKPHKWLDNLGAKRVEDLTKVEIAEYWRGFEENPSGTKDWGYE